MTRVLVFCLGLAAALSGGGCGSACPSSERVVDEGARWTTGPILRFETSSAEGPFLPFEGGTLLRVRHGLGVAPDEVHVTLSFSERPVGGGGYSQAAGNQALILHQNDEEIAIKNDSCASYWIRVTAQAWPKADAGVSDAKGD